MVRSPRISARVSRENGHFTITGKSERMKLHVSLAPLSRNFPRNQPSWGKAMVSKTIVELRALAKSRGLKGYSRLSIAEVRRVLAPPKKPAAPKAKKPKPVVKKTAAKPAMRPLRHAPTKKTAVHPAPVPPASGSTREEPSVNLLSSAARLSSDEERVEDAKYVVTPRGIAISLRPSITDLGEDIDRLPVLREPALCLLPQKPGVLHAYWVLDPGATARQPGMKLRLCRIADDTLHVMQEITLPSERGHWYFHIDDQSEPGGFYAHLGYYRDTGEFVTAILRGIARIPSLYASGRTDRQWWVSDRKFREMYLRAGG